MAAFDGTVWTRAEFVKHLEGISLPSWIYAVTLHSMWAPNIEIQRDTTKSEDSKVDASQRMKNAWGEVKKRLKGKGWHLSIFEGGWIGKGCDLREQGVHAHSWNKNSIGIEMAANFDVQGRLAGGKIVKSDDPYSGPGLQILDTAAFVFAQILKKRGLAANKDTVRFHKHEAAARRGSKQCPGRRVDEGDFIKRVQSYMGQEVVDLTPEEDDPIGTVLQTQERLKVHGFDPGPLDGVWGPKTRSAVLDFQRKLGLSWKPALEQASYAQIVGPYTYHMLMKEPASAVILTPPVASEKVDVPVLVPPEAKIPVADLKPSEFAISWMKRFEGLRLTAYDDVGSYAIGYGHNATSGRPPRPHKGMTITEAEANNILAQDAEAIAGEVRKVLKGHAFTQNQFDALVLNNFQLGQTAFTRNRATKAIKNGASDSDVHEQLIAQANATPNAGLKRRRLVQAQIWNGEKPTKW